MTLTLAHPGVPNRSFELPADRARLDRVAESMRGRGFAAQVATGVEHARELVLAAVPEGAEVHVALSETLKQLGITPVIDESGRYDSVRVKLNALDRVTQARERQQVGAAPEFLLASAHAVTDDGQLVIGSGSGSQLGAIAYSSRQVVLVVGHQKIVDDLDAGLRRVREYSLPLEWDRMQAAGYPGAFLAKTLILHGERPGRISVILVPETLGF